MAPMGDENVERWLSAIEPRPAPGSRIEVIYLAHEVAESGLDLNRVRIWFEDKGGWGFLDGVTEPYFEIVREKAPPYDPNALTYAEHMANEQP